MSLQLAHQIKMVLLFHFQRASSRRITIHFLIACPLDRFLKVQRMLVLVLSLVDFREGKDALSSFQDIDLLLISVYFSGSLQLMF